jgi:MoxR-like ATPase
MTFDIFAATDRPDPESNLKLRQLPPPPPWRSFGGDRPPERPDAIALKAPQDEIDRGRGFVCSPELAEAVNAALFLRRPLLLTGSPGTGKSTLIYAVARELRLGPVFRWSITSRATLRDGLYQYDALGRLHERERDKAAPDEIGRFIELGPLASALYPTSWPRALLIDEIDKGDLDLPNDLLNVFEDGEVHIPELARAATESKPVEVRLWHRSETVPITGGKFVCDQFPFVVLTSNGERTFPGAFLRRCIQFQIPDPSDDQLEQIVNKRLTKSGADVTAFIEDFNKRRAKGDIATDQLLNAIFLTLDDKRAIPADTRQRLHDILLRELSEKPSQ